MNEKPRILLFTGYGKGKTTAALGMALRAAGHGMRVLVLQFVKQDSTTGEIAAVKSIENIDIVQTGAGFVPQPDHPKFPEHLEAAEAGLRRAAEAVLSGKYALVILDEICVAVARGLIPEKDVLELSRRLPQGTRLVLTGRDATPALIEMADTVSDVRCVKHALQAGQPAQKGVER
ncbi:MAG: cob(I)yrinic acid a,c-diamide adenosyltransferase [Pirellulaceae bacterium]